MDVAAIALGANLIEKTITEDRSTRSVEHVFSLEPAEMRQFIRVVRDVESALGAKRRILAPAELKKRQAMRRSTHLANDTKAGQRLKDIKVTFSRPGHGLSPADWERMADAVLKHDLPAGHCLTLADLT